MKNTTAYFISDDTDNNIVCIDCKKCTLTKKTVAPEIIEQIKEKIKESNIIDLTYKPCTSDAAFSDGVINHFFINNGGNAKEIEIQDLSRVNPEKIQPLTDILNCIKKLLIPEGIDEYYFSLVFE